MTFSKGRQGRGGGGGEVKRQISKGMLVKNKKKGHPLRLAFPRLSRPRVHQFSRKEGAHQNKELELYCSVLRVTRDLNSHVIEKRRKSHREGRMTKKKSIRVLPPHHPPI